MRPLQLSACVVDLDAGSVARGGALLTLTSTELALLRALSERLGQPVSRELLLREAWGFERPAHTRCVDSAMRRLRVKLEADPAEPRHLLKVYGVGYALDPVGEVASPSGLVRREERVWLARALERGGPITVLGPPGGGARALVESLRGEHAEADLVAAESPRDLAGEQLLVLGSLDPAEARRWVEARGPGAAEGWEALIEAVDRLPLPLEELCARARLLSPTEMLERLVEAPERLLPRSAERVGARWSALPEALRADLVRLAAFAREAVPVRHAEALLGEGALERLEALALRGLLLREARAQTWLRLPLLLRRHARAAVGPEERGAHLAWCLAQAEALHARYPGPDAERAVDEMMSMWSELQQAHTLALGQDPVAALRLALAANTALRRKGRWDRIAALEVEGATSAWALPPLWRSRWHQLRSERRRVQGELLGAAEDAERALEEAEAAGDRVERGMALGQRGVVAHTRGLRAEAERDYRAAAQALEAGPARSRASWMSNLGSLLSRRGADAEAEALWQELIGLWQREGDARMEARVRGELARAWVERGLQGRAEAELQRVLEVWSRLDDPQALAVTQLRLGLLRLDQGCWAEAREAFDAAEARARRLGEPRTQAQARGFSGVAWLLQGRPEEAEGALRACVAQHRAEVGAGLEVAALGWLVALEAQAGRREEAEHSARAARALEDPPGTQLLLQMAWLGLDRPGDKRLEAAARAQARALWQSAEAPAARDLELRLARRHLGRRLGLRASGGGGAGPGLPRL